MPREIRVARIDEFDELNCKLIEVDGSSIALYKIGEAFHAIRNACPHTGAPLAAGQLHGCELTCPWHGWTFDLTTGQSTMVPFARLETVDVTVKRGELHLVLE